MLLMSVESIDCEVLDELIDELDIKSQSQHLGERSDDYWVCQRRHPRYPFRVLCKVRFLTAGSFTVMELPGRTRNLSRNGVGLLARRVFATGEAIEVEILPPGKPPHFMAGLVRFCRYAGRGYHELGVLLKGAGPEPIISGHPILAMQTLDWLRPASGTAERRRD